MKTLILVLLLFAAGLPISAQQPTSEQFSSDFDYLVGYLRENYAYTQKKRIDWIRIRRVYRPQLSRVTTKAEFVSFLERVLDELYDNHTSLNTNLQSSPRLVPTGLDVWAEWIAGRAVITQLRSGFSAEQSGLKVGMEVVSINGLPVKQAASLRMPRALTTVNADTRNWALRAALAGTHDRPRTIEARNLRRVVTVYQLDQPNHTTVDHYEYVPKVDWKMLSHQIGYIKINDLISTDIVAQFDAALEHMKESRGLILDLRDIPRGGNTDVAEPILGRFVDRQMGYQLVVPLREASYVKPVMPTGSWTYEKPIVVLVNRWTGSMGEGMAIGLDAMKRATVVGTRMARLNGGILNMQLPNTKIGVTFAGERLNHVNGTPREEFVPPVLVNLLDRRMEGSKDPIFEVGYRRLLSMIGGVAIVSSQEFVRFEDHRLRGRGLGLRPRC